jgi:hypothetical protein
MSKICPFKVKGLCFDFFHKCSVWFWSLSSSTSSFLGLFTLNKFYRSWDHAFVAFEIVQNEQYIVARSKGV